MGRNYERLSIKEFGNHLLESNDLDPIYVALYKCIKEYNWPEPQIARWLVAYWCFYHAGVASWMCTMDGDRFWHWMDVASANITESPAGGRWPRGQERRHFRGAQSAKAIKRLALTYGDAPEQMVTRVGVRLAIVDNNGMPVPQDLSVAEVMKRVKTHYLFGDWIGFKVADMLDRCLGVPVSFDQGHVFMFADPVKAALMLWRQHLGLNENAKPKDQDHVLMLIVSELTAMFMTYKAPPLYDRPVGIQEVETILCKWKSHMNGHYPLWNDIDEITAGLDPWTGESEAAAAFAAAMPQRETSDAT